MFTVTNLVREVKIIVIQDSVTVQVTSLSRFDILLVLVSQAVLDFLSKDLLWQKRQSIYCQVKLMMEAEF